MSTAQRENRPHAGAVIARVLGQVDPIVPAFVDLFPTMQHRPYNSPKPGPLGRSGTRRGPSVRNRLEWNHPALNP